MSEKKINKLCEIEGQTTEELLSAALMDGVCKGICMNEDCDYTTNTEPDQDRGYCEVCGTNTVQSICILMGVI